MLSLMVLSRMKKSNQVSARRLLSSFRDAESRGDVEGMAYLCGQLIIAHVFKFNYRAVRKYIKIFDGLRSEYGSSDAVQGRENSSFFATSKLLQALSLEMEDAVFRLSELARDYVRKGAVREAVRTYEICLLLSQAKLGVRSAEEMDIADDLAMIYLLRGQYSKALEMFKNGASPDNGRSNLLKFCSEFCGPLPKVLKAFVTNTSGNKPVLDIGDDWSAIGD